MIEIFICKQCPYSPAPSGNDGGIHQREHYPSALKLCPKSHSASWRLWLSWALFSAEVNVIQRCDSTSTLLCQCQHNRHGFQTVCYLALCWARCSFNNPDSPYKSEDLVTILLVCVTSFNGEKVTFAYSPVPLTFLKGSPVRNEIWVWHL